jgi:P-type Na+/K+ transporter
MEESLPHGVPRSGNYADHSATSKSADDGGNVDDPPPIPSASSSIQLNEKSAGESRLDNPKPIKNHEDSDVNTHAHTLALSDVATQLQTSLQ